MLTATNGRLWTLKRGVRFLLVRAFWGSLVSQAGAQPVGGTASAWERAASPAEAESWVSCAILGRGCPARSRASPSWWSRLPQDGCVLKTQLSWPLGKARSRLPPSAHRAAPIRQLGETLQSFPAPGVLWRTVDWQGNYMFQKTQEIFRNNSKQMLFRDSISNQERRESVRFMWGALLL